MKYILPFAILFLHTAAIAQSSNHFGTFPTIDHSGTISKKLDYSLYYFAGLNLFNSKVNNAREPANFFVFYSEQALTYKVNKHLSFTGSYVYERQHPVDNNYRNENRFYLQGTYKHDIRRSTLKHRLRFDGRFIENRATRMSPLTTRARYLLGISTPLRKAKDNIYFSAYNEFFFNTDKSTTVIYGENWAYAGLGFKTPTAGNFEIGPLYIFWVNNTRYDLTNFYYLQVTWTTHIDLTRKKK